MVFCACGLLNNRHNNHNNRLMVNEGNVERERRRASARARAATDRPHVSIWCEQKSCTIITLNL